MVTVFIFRYALNVLSDVIRLLHQCIELNRFEMNFCSSSIHAYCHAQWRRQLVGTWARAPLAFERIFFRHRLYVETSCLVWFGTMPNSNSALFVQPYSLWNDAITGYNGACAKIVFTARRHALARSLLSAAVRLSATFVYCIVSRRLKISSNIFLGPVAQYDSSF